jgi:hypothetical protein
MTLCVMYKDRERGRGDEGARGYFIDEGQVGVLLSLSLDECVCVCVRVCDSVCVCVTVCVCVCVCVCVLDELDPKVQSSCVRFSQPLGSSSLSGNDDQRHTHISYICAHKKAHSCMRAHVCTHAHYIGWSS